MARCSTRGPLRGGELGTTGRASGRCQGWQRLFARAGDGMDAGVEATQEQLPEPARKARPRLTDLPGRSPASAKRGAPLFGYFLSGKREKVTRPPKEDESSCSSSVHTSAEGKGGEPCSPSVRATRTSVRFPARASVSATSQSHTSRCRRRDPSAGGCCRGPLRAPRPACRWRR